MIFDSSRYPESGVAKANGENIIRLLYPNSESKASSVNLIITSGNPVIKVNGEEIKPIRKFYLETTNGEAIEYYYRGERQLPGGKKEGSIGSLFIEGDAEYYINAQMISK